MYNLEESQDRNRSIKDRDRDEGLDGEHTITERIDTPIEPESVWDTVHGCPVGGGLVGYL